MSIMKKDMGGAASVLGLAAIIIRMNLNVRLRVLIPIVENSISSNSFRPGDIFESRKGLTVEVNNTDAEGRLILADALAHADEESPDLLICMATLTGAARVALGTDIVPFYSTSEDFSDFLIKAGQDSFDPVWQLPFFTPYESLIEPDIADLDNAPANGMAGSITAALFLKRFIENTKIFSHFDIYGWSQTSKPGRQRGGLMQGSRAIFEAINRMIC
jgi:leucyl aminopeptidase